MRAEAAQPRAARRGGLLITGTEDHVCSPDSRLEGGGVGVGPAPPI
jgi:hypothetical protein